MSTHVLRIPLRITNLRRDDHGQWVATVNEQAVFRTFGSWQMAGPGKLRRDVLPYIAAELQDRVRTLERAERKAGRSA